MCYLIAVSYYRHRHSQERNTFGRDGEEGTENECTNVVVFQSLGDFINGPIEGQNPERFYSL